MIDLSLLRGGAAAWTITGPGITDSVELVSVSGLNIGTTLDGEAQGATVTVELIDRLESLTDAALDAHDAPFIISLNGAAIWCGWPTNVDRTKNHLTMTLKGALDKVDKEYQRNTIDGETPLAAWQNWERQALAQKAPGYQLETLIYNDDYHRNLARVATPASTLDTWPDATGDAVEQPQLFGLARRQDSGGVWRRDQQDWGRIDQKFLTISDFTPCPEGKIPSDDTGNPIQWHLANGKLKFQFYFAATETQSWDTTSRPPDCDWLEGRDGYAACESVQLFVGDQRRETLDVHNAAITPDSERTKKYVITHSGQFVKKEGKWTIAKRQTKTVTQGIYSNTRHGRADQLWSHWHNILTEGRPEWIDDDPVSDGQDWDGAAIGWAGGDKTPWGAALSIGYTHPDTDTWPTSTIYPVPAFIVDQYIEPTTINATPWNADYADQSRWIAGLGVAEQYKLDGANQYVLKSVNLCPEKGEIFPIPLCASTCTQLQLVGNSPLPGVINCNYRDWMGNENAVPFNNFGAGQDSKDIAICQGSILPWPKDDCEYVSASEDPGVGCSYWRYQRDPTKWHNGAGHIYNRYSGAHYRPAENIAYTAHLNDTFGAAFGLGYLRKNGDFSPAIYAPQSTANGQLLDYGVRWNGATTKCFANNYHLTAYHDDLVLDASPLQMLKKASERVYSLPQRPSYQVTAPLIFATAEIGAVVLLKVKSWDDDRPWLAIILKKVIDTAAAGVQLTIAPMHPVQYADYGNWDGLKQLTERIFPADLIPSPVPPSWHLVSGVAATLTSSTSVYSGCHYININNGSTLTTRTAPGWDRTQNIFIEVDGVAYYCAPVTTNLKAELTAAHGFARSSASSTTSRANNWIGGGVYILGRYNDECYLFLTDDLYARYSAGQATIKLWYNATAEYY